MAKILSFDVGIKNLAYCILDINSEKNTFEIKNWDIIDLTTNTVKYTCSHTNKNNVCDKKATKFIVENNINKYYCSIHSNKLPICMIDTIIPKFIISETQNKCMSCAKLSNDVYDKNYYCVMHKKKLLTKYTCKTPKCEKLIHKTLITDKQDEKLIGWCLEHYEKEYNSYIRKKLKSVSQNCNKISLANLCQTMYKKLDAIPEFNNVSKVFIENQPTFINPTMKTISAFLFSYFVNRTLREKTIYTIENIIFCAPSNKIKVAGSSGEKIIKEAKEEITYAITKDIAVKCCNELIKDDKKALELFNSHEKKDDMADAFLQGFIKSFGTPLPKHYEDKIKELNLKKKDKKKS